MRQIGIFVSLIVLVFSAAIWAQTTLPKPDPTLKNLDALAGHRTYEVQYKAGPLGPGGKFNGEYSIRRILGDFFFQDEQIEKGPMGETQALDIYRYNRSKWKSSPDSARRLHFSPFSVVTFRRWRQIARGQLHPK